MSLANMLVFLRINCAWVLKTWALPLQWKLSDRRLPPQLFWWLAPMRICQLTSLVLLRRNASHCICGFQARRVACRLLFCLPQSGRHIRLVAICLCSTGSCHCMLQEDQHLTSNCNCQRSYTSILFGEENYEGQNVQQHTRLAFIQATRSWEESIGWHSRMQLSLYQQWWIGCSMFMAMLVHFETVAMQYPNRYQTEK